MLAHRMNRLSFLACALLAAPGWAVAESGGHEHHHAAGGETRAALPPGAAPGASGPGQLVTLQVRKGKNEDEKDTLEALVLRGGKAQTDLLVEFSTPRLFGHMALGSAKTDAKGLASIPFPVDLPGEARSGQLRVHARVIDSRSYHGLGEASVEGGRTLAPIEDPFPRQIWSPNTDWYLLSTIPVLILAVWSVYSFALLQLLRLRKMSQR